MIEAFFEPVQEFHEEDEEPDKNEGAPVLVNNSLY